MYYPEVLNKDVYMIISDNKIKAHGWITKVYCDIDNKKFSEVSNMKKAKRKNSVPEKLMEALG